MFGSQAFRVLFGVRSMGVQLARCIHTPLYGVALLRSLLSVAVSLILSGSLKSFLQSCGQEH